MGSEPGFHGLKAFLGHEVGGRRVAEEGVEEDGVVLLGCGVEEVASVVDVEVDFCGVEVEEVSPDCDDAWVDFDDIDGDAFFGELPGDDAHAEADDEGGFDFFGVGCCEVVEHGGEDGKALPGDGIVDVLFQEVVEVVAGAVLRFEHLHQAEVGVAPGEFFEAARNGDGFDSDGGQIGRGGDGQSGACLNDGLRSALPEEEVNPGEDEENGGGGEHGDGVGGNGNEKVADRHGAKDAAKRADGGDAPYEAADSLRGLGQNPDHKRAGNCHQGEGNKEKTQRRQR